MRTSRFVLVVSMVSLLTAACEEDGKHGKGAASAAVASAPPPAPTPEPPKEPPAPKKPARPEKIETALTAERRATIEQATPDAKGFLVLSDLEQKLAANKGLKDKDAGVKAFDKLASGKWVLFTGPISNPTPTGFELGVTFVPQMKGDMIGMSRQWFPVAFSEVKGYDADELKAGQMVVVLARYGGKQKASPGEELVAFGRW